MTPFRAVPMPTAIAERFRTRLVDDGGNTILHRTATAGDAPCRHCLRNGLAGDAMLLGSYNLPGPRGVYWTLSPIFLHARGCAAYDGRDEVPEIVRGRLVSVRAYDADDLCLYDLGHAGDGDAIDAPLARALDDPRTSFVNIHTAKPGCLLCRVERA